jgi:hypothetical protein
MAREITAEDSRTRGAALIAVVLALGVGTAALCVPTLGATLDGLVPARLAHEPAMTTTLVTQVVEGPEGTTRTTTETRESRSTPNESLLADGLGLPGLLTLIRLLIVLLVAFLVGAFVQRSLLGEFGFEFAGFRLPSIQGADLERQKAAFVNASSAPSPPRRKPPAEPIIAAEGSYEDVHDPRLALVQLRIDLERRLAGLASRSGVAVGSATETLDRLVEHGALSKAQATPLRRLIQLGNAASRGSPVDASALPVVREIAPQILRSLDEIPGDRTH